MHLKACVTSPKFLVSRNNYIQCALIGSCTQQLKICNKCIESACYYNIFASPYIMLYCNYYVLSISSVAVLVIFLNF